MLTNVFIPQTYQQGFQIKPAAGGISVYSGHLRRLLSFGFQLKKKKKINSISLNLLTQRTTESQVTDHPIATSRISAG
jgi:hypothetical protein